tara:strand:+ start:51 stop:509 length:459 start_codon:yes stop_codon:yes gene_type:complete
MGNDYNISYSSYQWVYSYAMSDNWKKLQADTIDKTNIVNKKYKQLLNVIKDPDGYNTNLASKRRVENLEETQEEIKTQIEDLSINSHPPVEFTKKLNELHDKIDSIYSIIEVLSDRLNKLEYEGELTYGEPFNVGRSNKYVIVSLRRKDKEK